MKYAIILSSIITISSITYALSIETDPQKIIEQENREKILTCMDDVYSSTGSAYQLQKKIEKCSKIGLKTISGTASGAIVPPPERYTQKHTLVLTGSHDYRQYANMHPGVAGWKNNNPSGLTWGVSNILKGHWDDAGIDYKKGTARPANEKGHYILFGSVEHGIRAKMISIRERWGEATVSHFLSGWGTDDIKLSFSQNKRIKELSEDEFMELFIQQLRKESPGYISQLVKDGILIIN